MSRFCRFFVGVLGPIAWAMLANLAAGATQFEWNTPASGNWTDPTKWTPTGIPGATAGDDRVFIGRGAGNGATVILNSAVPSIATLNLGDGGTGALFVEPGGSLTTTTTTSSDAIGFNGNGTLLMSGGTVTLGRRLVVDNGAVVVNNGLLRLPSTAGDLSLAVSGTGEVDVGIHGRLEVGRDMIVGDGGTGSLVANGDVRIARNLIVGGPLGEALLTMTSGQLQVAGSLFVGGPLSASASMSIEAPNVNVTAAAFIISQSGSLNLDEVQGSWTPIHATAASLAGRLTVEFDAMPAVGSIFEVLKVTGDAPHTSTFIGKPQGAIFAADNMGVTMRINYAANLDGGTVANDVTLTVMPRGDVTLDGLINRADVARIAANWNSVGGFAEGDLDGDGRVGLDDLMIVQRNWGKLPASSSSAAVPEPATWSMLLAGFALIAAARRPLGLARRANRR